MSTDKQPISGRRFRNKTTKKEGTVLAESSGKVTLKYDSGRISSKQWHYFDYDCELLPEVGAKHEIRLYVGRGDKQFAPFDVSAFLEVLNRELPLLGSGKVNATIEQAISAATGNRLAGGEPLKGATIEFMARDPKTGLTM